MKTLLALCLCSWAALGQVWVQPITGALTRIQSIAVDNQENCFVSGFSLGDTNKIIGFGQTNLNGGAFFARYSRKGELVYAQHTEGARLLLMVGSKLFALEESQVWSIADNGRKTLKAGLESPEIFVSQISACGENSLVIGGYFREALTIGKDTLVATEPFIRTSFAARLNANGKAIWMTELPATAVFDVAGTRTGGAYALTRYQVLEAIPALGSNYRDVFAVRALGRHGESLWTSEIPGEYLGLADRIAADRAGNCFIQGRFAGRIDVGGTSLAYQLGRTAYVVRLNDGGDPVFGWILNEFSFGEAFALDRAGKWFVGTTFWSEANDYDGLILENGDGAALQFGGFDADYVQKIATGPKADGTIYVAGECYSVPATVGSTVLTNAGAFIGKFNLR
jgi:hypothetical protein